MAASGILSKGISIVPPTKADEKLLFRVFDHAAPIGYARLKKLDTLPRRRANDTALAGGSQSYELKMIEIAQNYRQQGVGSTLLKEIIRYCRDSNIQRLTGEIKGDARTLRHWYRKNGFVVDSMDRIELLHSRRC